MKTKKAKKVKVEWIEIPRTMLMAKYQCPGCRTYFESYTLEENVTRFICKCVQEIIVENSK